jgi:two-component system cell cycle sensor histidine kinase/response regulator CckA
MDESTATRKVRVLIVDDEESVRTFVERVLVDAGYEVALAANGPEAIRIGSQQGPFELFVIDLVMPLMNGSDVARFLRRADPDAKILYFTGHSDQLFSETSTLSANEAFLEKPVSIKGLREAVSLLLFGRIQR